MRNVVSTANGGQLGRPPSAYGAINLTDAFHGTTRFDSLRNVRLRVRFIRQFDLRSACLISDIFLALGFNEHGRYLCRPSLGSLWTPTNCRLRPTLSPIENALRDFVDQHHPPGQLNQVIIWRVCASSEDASKATYPLTNGPKATDRRVTCVW